MKTIFSFLLVKAIALCVVRGVLAAESYTQVEQLSDPPDQWLKRDKPSPSSIVKFRLAVDASDTKAFEQHVIDLSTPSHPNYGRHMTKDEIDTFLRPPSEVLDSLTSWLRSENVAVDSIEINNNWITFEAPVSRAEHMLKTEFFNYQHNESQTVAIRTLGYSVPDEIRHHVSMIQPTTRFGDPSANKRLFNTGSSSPLPDKDISCGTVVTPKCLRELYGLENTTATPDTRNKLGVAGFLEQYARHADLKHFLETYEPDRADANFSVVSINGGLNEQNSWRQSIEASLDLQYALSIGYHAMATFYTTGGRGPLVPDGEQPNPNASTNEPYLEQLHYLVSLPEQELPAVLTMSYSEPEQSVPAAYATAVCNLFAQLGARGVSVIFSSGDSGPGGGTCSTNDGTSRTRFLPEFPPGCPFVTSVGGVSGVNPERATGFSGGGFSDLFARPSYQDHAVRGFLSQIGSQWKGLYNPNGRGIPDVSAQSSQFVVRDHGLYLHVGGTR